MKIFNIFWGAFLIFPCMAFADPPSDGFQISSTAIEDNAMIPSKYTCDGSNFNPPLTFKNAPSGTKSLVLTVSDPDAPNGRWSHWVVYNIPPNTDEISENSNPGLSGVNDFGKQAYGGPCPPGGKLHHYIFNAYALDTIIMIKDGPSISDVEKSIEGHILAQARLVGTYEK